jgi:uncharacterized protein
MRSIFDTNRTALVTGASSGIGLELARALAPKLDVLIIVARRIDRLQRIADELSSGFPRLKVIVEAADLSQSQAVDHLLQRLAERRVAIDILVNNAGLGESELFESSPWSRIDQIVQVNILAMLRISRELLPAMIQRQHGAILNVGSGAGYAAMPNAAVYTASKHFVRAFTESLRAQVADTGITVSEAAPGPVDTEFDQVAGIGEGGATPARNIFGMSAEACAREIAEEFGRRLAGDLPRPQLPLDDARAAVGPTAAYHAVGRQRCSHVAGEKRIIRRSRSGSVTLDR